MAGAVIPAAELTLELLKTILDAMGNIERKIALGVSNETDNITWRNGGAYFYSGTSDVALPYEVKPGEAFTYNARKTSGPVATGCVGVIAYKTSDGNTLGVMFSVPFDYNLYSNWWDAKIYQGNREADNSMYEDLYYGDPFKGDDHYHEKTLLGGIRMRGYMASSGTPRLLINIMKS